MFFAVLLSPRANTGSGDVTEPECTVRGLIEGFLKGVGFDTLPGRIGLGFLLPKEGSGASLSSIAGSVVMVVILLLTAQQALSSLQLGQLSELLGGLLASFAVMVVAYYTTVVAIRFGLDPDTYGIPMVTSSLDFVGAFTLILALVAVGVA